MKKVLIVQPLHQQALTLLDARLDLEYEVVTDFSEENLLKHLPTAHAMTVRTAPLSKAVLAVAKNLCVISKHGVGYDNIPVTYCSERNIPVTVVGPVNAVAVAEHTMFLLLTAAKVGVEFDSAVREDRFSARDEMQGMELNGKRLLLIGYGHIGREVARRAAAFGMQILVFDPYASRSADIPINFVDSLDAALMQSDVVSLHVPLTTETKGILGEKELALLPKGAIVVNAARGGLIDEAALVQAVAVGALHGAGLDTFETEPLPVSSKLIAEKRIVLSPHSAALTEDTLIAMGVKTVENAIAALEGQLNFDLVVNKEILKGITHASQ